MKMFHINFYAKLSCYTTVDVSHYIPIDIHTYTHTHTHTIYLFFLYFSNTAQTQKANIK